MQSVRVNLGCGRNVREDFVNVDRLPFPGVVVADVEHGLPFRDRSVDHVLASHMLEHVDRFDLAWREIHRILKVRGRLEVIVPYGPDTNPWHRRHFDEKSVEMLTNPGNNLEGGRWWKLVEERIVSRGFPWWHVRKYFGWDVPLGVKKEIRFVLERVE